MDPYTLGIFNDTIGQCIPVIRIVFALMADTPSVKILSRSCQNQNQRTKAYDIWFSPKHLAPVRPQDVDIWKYLVDAACRWEDIYEADDLGTQGMMKTMNPGIAGDRAFWREWFPDNLM